MAKGKVKAIKAVKAVKATGAQEPTIELSFNSQEVTAIMQVLQVAMQGGSLDLVDSISHFKNKVTQKVKEVNEAAQA